MIRPTSILFVALAGCAPTTAASPAGPSSASWRCFHAAPAQPGTRVEVSWFEQRYQGGVLETAELDEGETGPLATRLAYRRVGDHLEADHYGVHMVATVPTDGTRWQVRVTEGESLAHVDDAVIDASGLTITTTSLADPTDPSDHAVVTVAHFVTAPCDTADAMLAKH